MRSSRCTESTSTPSRKRCPTCGKKVVFAGPPGIGFSRERPAAVNELLVEFLIGGPRTRGPSPRFDLLTRSRNRLPPPRPPGLSARYGGRMGRGERLPLVGGPAVTDPRRLDLDGPRCRSGWPARGGGRCGRPGVVRGSSLRGAMSSIPGGDLGLDGPWASRRRAPSPRELGEARPGWGPGARCGSRW